MITFQRARRSLAIGRWAAGLAAATITCSAGTALADEAQLPDLGRLSLEELADLEVTSVSRQPEPMADAGAAIFVITNDDARRSGALTLPELLRLAPNLEVARIDALDYSITARGFGGFEAANKLLVQIDGRSVYTPLFSGVDWDQHHLLLDDLDRVEVVSGPGGALWGANAVNGVVSITTRRAEDTQGLLLAGTAGTQDSDVRLRYGGRLGERGAYRVYVTGYDRGDLKRADGADADDGWSGLQGGFRADWSGALDELTLQGDVQDNEIASPAATSGYVRGGNLLGRWTRQTGRTGRLEIQAYYDRSEREARLIYDALETWDVELQHAFGWRAHQLVWGGGFRRTQDEFRTLFQPNLLNPAARTMTIGSFFVQDQIALREDLTLTLGLKLEDNSYTELDYMPSVRLAWRLPGDHLLWAAVSRAIRNPSRIERDFAIAGLVAPGFMASEELIAYEAGYRGRPSVRSSLSVNLFYNAYDDLRTNELDRRLAEPIYVGNSLEGVTYGIEAWGALDVTDRWRLSAGASWLGKDFKLKPGSLDVSRREAEGVDPDYWLKLRSQMQLTDRLELDLFLRAYGETPASAASGYLGAPAYADLAARLGWRITPALELSLAGNNLLDDQHPEASEARRKEPPRSLQLGLRWAY
jgi:iron complex outermembrane recepter protein